MSFLPVLPVCLPRRGHGGRAVRCVVGWPSGGLSHARPEPGRAPCCLCCLRFPVRCGSGGGGARRRTGCRARYPRPLIRNAWRRRHC